MLVFSGFMRMYRPELHSVVAFADNKMAQQVNTFVVSCSLFSSAMLPTIDSGGLKSYKTDKASLGVWVQDAKGGF